MGFHSSVLRPQSRPTIDSHPTIKNASNMNRDFSSGRNWKRWKPCPSVASPASNSPEWIWLDGGLRTTIRLQNDPRNSAAGRAWLEAVKLEIEVGPYRFQPAAIKIKSPTWRDRYDNALNGGLRMLIRLHNCGSDCPQPRPSKNAAPLYEFTWYTFFGDR